MVTDPLEPLHRALNNLKILGVQERRHLERLRQLGEYPGEEVMGKVGALFSYYDDLRKANEEAMRGELDQAAVNLRLDVTRVLSSLIKGLEDFMSLWKD